MKFKTNYPAIDGSAVLSIQIKFLKFLWLHLNGRGGDTNCVSWLYCCIRIDFGTIEAEKLGVYCIFSFCLFYNLLSILVFIITQMMKLSNQLLYVLDPVLVCCVVLRLTSTSQERCRIMKCFLPSIMVLQLFYVNIATLKEVTCPYWETNSWLLFMNIVLMFVSPKLILIL